MKCVFPSGKSKSRWQTLEHFENLGRSLRVGVYVTFWEKKLYLIPSEARREAPSESKFIILLHAKHAERMRIISRVWFGFGHKSSYWFGIHSSLAMVSQLTSAVWRHRKQSVIWLNVHKSFYWFGIRSCLATKSRHIPIDVTSPVWRQEAFLGFQATVPQVRTGSMTNAVIIVREKMFAISEISRPPKL